MLTKKNCVLLNSGQEWLLAASHLFHSYAYATNYVLYILLSRIKEYKCLGKVIHQIEIKNEWFLSAVFTAKFGLVFVLILENVFPQTFHFKDNRKSTGSSKKR